MFRIHISVVFKGTSVSNVILSNTSLIIKNLRISFHIFPEKLWLDYESKLHKSTDWKVKINHPSSVGSYFYNTFKCFVWLWTLTFEEKFHGILIFDILCTILAERLHEGTKSVDENMFLLCVLLRRAFILFLFF